MYLQQNPGLYFPQIFCVSEKPLSAEPVNISKP